MIHTLKCDGNCSSEQCRRMGGGWYAYGSSGKQGFARFETVKIGPFLSQGEAQNAAERVFPMYVQQMNKHCKHQDPEDGCCLHPDNMTPECHDVACPLPKPAPVEPPAKHGRPVPLPPHTISEEDGNMLTSAVTGSSRQRQRWGKGRGGAYHPRLLLCLPQGSALQARR